MAKTDERGTFYMCGCWHEGEPDQHPHDCPTHQKPWAYRYEPARIRHNHEALAAGIGPRPRIHGS